MSNIDYPPKSGNEIRFNPDNFKRATDALTLKDADQRYLRLSGGSISGSLTIGGNLDIQTLSINGGSTLDLSGLSYITGITAGTSSPNKALVVDSGRNITGIQGICLGSSTDTSRYLSLLVNSTAGTTLYGLTYGVDNSTNNQSEFAFYYAGSGSTSNALSFGFYTNSNIFRINADQSVDVPFHNGTTGLRLGGTLITATAAEINYVDVTTAGTAQASKALILNSSKAIYDIGELSFSASGVNKVVLKKSTTGQGLYLYDTQSSSPAPTISILCANQSSPNFIEFDSAFTPDSFTISHKDGSAFTSGLRISSTNTTQASNVNANVMLAARNGTIPHVVVNDSQNQLHLFPQGLAELNTSYVQNVIIGEELLIRKNLQIGTSQDNATTKLISALDSTQATGTKRYITLGKNNVSNSQAEIYFHYDSSASDASYLGFGQFGKADQLTIAGNGWVGIATNSPVGPFHVNTTANLAYGAGGTNVYRLRTDNGITEGPALGPISYNTSAIFNGYIACTAMAMTSDRRLKCNIKDVSFEHIDNFYRTVIPKTYCFKYNKTKIEYGFIAQEVVKAGYLDLISMIGNEDLKGVIEDKEVDIDGVQLCLDYQKITMFNTVMIRSLMKEIEELRSIVETLTSKPALSKWMSKNS
jgi:hypothetical protein